MDEMQQTKRTCEQQSEMAAFMAYNVFATK